MGEKGGQHSHVHAAQDGSVSYIAMYVPRHKQLQGAQSPPPPLLFNPGGNTGYRTLNVKGKEEGGRRLCTEYIRTV